MLTCMKCLSVWLVVPCDNANLTAAQTASILELTSAMAGPGRQVLTALQFAAAVVLVLNPFTLLPTAL